jgi:hypothetical protein
MRRIRIVGGPAAVVAPADRGQWQQLRASRSRLPVWFSWYAHQGPYRRASSIPGAQPDLASAQQMTLLPAQALMTKPVNAVPNEPAAPRATGDASDDLAATRVLSAVHSRSASAPHWSRRQARLSVLS